MVLQSTAENFFRARMNYRELEELRTPRPAPFAQDDAGFAATSANHGVYVQWTLPAALRHGSASPDGGLEFPLVPNRWLVARLFRPRASEGPPGAPEVAAWVIESDVEGSPDGAIFLVERDGQPAQILLGKKVVHSAAAPWMEPGAAEPSFLRAVAESNPDFASYQPFCPNVFSIHDELRTHDVPAGTLSYFVLGWYADASADPLAAWPGGGDFTAFLEALRWTATSGSTTTSLYHGAAYAVPWDPDAGTAPPSPKDTATPKIAIANTSIDALVAFVEAAFSAPTQDQVPADLTPCEAASLFEAFNYGLLPALDQPGAAERIAETIHKHWFSAHAAGRTWTIVDAPETKGDTRPAPPSSDELEREASWLATLNDSQATYDQRARELIGAQRRIFELWWKQRAATLLDDEGEEPWNVSLQQLNDALDPSASGGVIARARALLQEMTALAEVIPTPAAEQTMDQAILAFAATKGLPPTRVLKATDAPRFWQATDPVLALSGTAHTWQISPDGPLACRWPAEIVTAITLRVDGSAAALSSSALAPYLPPLPWTGLPSVAAPLFAEFFLLDPANAPLVASIGGILASVEALAAAIAAAIASTGTRSALTPPHPWVQPWRPLYLDWEIDWYPLSFNQLNWAFDGNDYDATPSLLLPLEPDTGIQLAGRTVLSASAVTTLKIALDQYTREYPASPATAELKEVEALMSSVDGWDFLSQALGGLNTQLSGWSPTPTPIPLSDIAALIGAQGDTPPDPQRLHGRGAVPSSTFGGIRSGQMALRRLAVIDAFGQSLEIVTTQSAPYTEVLRGMGLDVSEPLVKLEPGRLVQLPPRLLQAARLNFEFVAGAAGTAIVGWLLPDHLGRALAAYGADGMLLGELLQAVAGDGSSIVAWSAGPDSPFATLDQLAEAQALLGGLLQTLSRTGPEALADLLRTIDETLWDVDSQGERADPATYALVGRPLAIVGASLSLELQSAPLTDTAWPYSIDPPPPRFLVQPFSVRLGQTGARQDGLIGYYADGDFATFNAALVPENAGDATSSYVRAIGAGNWIDLTFAASGPGPSRTLALVMDPHASVHATSGILPVKELTLPPAWVDGAIAAMRVTLRAGPLLTERRSIGAEMSTGPQDHVLLPIPPASSGSWRWRQPETDGSWSTSALAAADDVATFPEPPSILRHGAFEWTQAKMNTTPEK